MTKNTAESFGEIIETRRSVRVFESTPLPEADVLKVLEWSLLAPHSSNLQVWKFYWVEEKDCRDRLVEACFSQSAARTAPVLIVCTARPHRFVSSRSAFSQLTG
jgi:nitroreductase